MMISAPFISRTARAPLAAAAVSRALHLVSAALLLGGTVPMVHAQELQAETLVDDAPAGAVEMVVIVPADEAPEAPVVSEDGLAAYPATIEVPRHVELRRALMSEDELSVGTYERRRLTAEERNAFRLELQRAVRNAYQDDPAR